MILSGVLCYVNCSAPAQYQQQFTTTLHSIPKDLIFITTAARTSSLI